MKYTNKFHFPEPIVNAIANDPYERGEDTDYTVTELIKPARQVALERTHDSEIEVDISDCIFRLLGQAVHSILERAGVPERRYTVTILGKQVSGKIDRYVAKVGLLQDWKVTTVYRFKGGVVPEDIHAQLNSYAELLRMNGHQVNDQEAVGILRDWSKLELLRGRGLYPPHQTATVKIPIWPREHAKAFLEARVRAHEAAKVSLPECTDGERWAKPDWWAVMKVGRKSALRLLGTEALAKAFIEEKSKALGYRIASGANTHAVMNLKRKTPVRVFKDRRDAEDFIKGEEARSVSDLCIVYRPGENVRCQSYCNAAPFCLQWKKLQQPPKEGFRTAPAHAPAAATISMGKPRLSLVKGSTK